MDRHRWADLVLGAGWSAPLGADVVGTWPDRCPVPCRRRGIRRRGRTRNRARQVQPVRVHAARRGNRRAKAQADPAVAAREAQVVPALQRAGRGIGPGRPAYPRRPGRRPVRRQRAEGLDILRGHRRLRVAGRPHRLGRAQTPGHQLLHAAHAATRCRSPAHPPDNRRIGIQRGFPDRCRGVGREPGRRLNAGWRCCRPHWATNGG